MLTNREDIGRDDRPHNRNTEQHVQRRSWNVDLAERVVRCFARGRLGVLSAQSDGALPALPLLEDGRDERAVHDPGREKSDEVEVGMSVVLHDDAEDRYCLRLRARVSGNTRMQCNVRDARSRRLRRATGARTRAGWG